MQSAAYFQYFQTAAHFSSFFVQRFSELSRILLLLVPHIIYIPARSVPVSVHSITSRSSTRNLPLSIVRCSSTFLCQVTFHNDHSLMLHGFCPATWHISAPSFRTAPHEGPQFRTFESFHQTFDSFESFELSLSCFHFVSSLNSMCDFLVSVV